MLNLTFISYFLYDEVTKHFKIPLCNYLINAVTVKETKPTHLYVHNEPLILFLHGHVVITDWGCVYACVCVCVCVCMCVCVWEKRHSLKNRGWGRQGKQAERVFHFHGNQAVQASVPSVIQLYTDRAWHHQHCSLVCSAQESERQIITAAFHSEPSCIDVCGIVDLLVGGCFAWFYNNIRCLCCAYSSLSFLGW